MAKRLNYGENEGNDGKSPKAQSKAPLKDILGPLAQLTLRPVDFNSREYLFSAHLVQFIVRRQIYDFELIGRFAFETDENIFPAKTRRIISHFLRKESVDVYFEFALCFQDREIDNDNFSAFCWYMKDYYGGCLNSRGGILRFVVCLSHYAALAIMKDATVAPYMALRRIIEIVTDFINSEKDGAATFLDDLDGAAQELSDNYFQLRMKCKCFIYSKDDPSRGNCCPKDN